MLDKLKTFLQHSFVYSISNVAAKASGIILLPIYTSFISLSDFGILAIVEVSITIGVQILILGQSQALVMFNDLSEYAEKKGSIFFTIFLLLFGVCSVFVLTAFTSSNLISFSDFKIPYLKNLIIFSSIIISFRIINNLFLDKIRADQKSISYTIINLVRLFITIILIVYFVAYKNLSVMGVMYSYLVADGLIFLGLLPKMFSQMEAKFDQKILSVSFNFGVPLIFTSIAFTILNVSDRYILQFLTTSEQVALYDLGYRVAGSLNMFIIMPFSLSLMPIAYKIYGKPGDKRYYSKLMTYLTYIMIWGGLGLSIYSEEIIKLFSRNPQYWPAYLVVPIVVFAYVLSGMRMLVVLGQFLTKNTGSIATTTVYAALLNIVLNFIFIPIYGFIAAAYTTLISFIFLFLISDRISDRYYHIPFEYRKLGKIIVVGCLLYFLAVVIPIKIFFLSILYKFIFLLAFPFVLYLLNFYERVEVQSILGFIRKWKNFREWKNFIIKDRSL